jgi:acetyl esterase/lipase
VSRRRLGTFLVAVAATASVAAAGPGGGNRQAVPCTDSSGQARNLDLRVDGEPAHGLYAVPDTAPEALVVFAHGYGHTSESWREHIVRTVTETGAIALAMDYRGTEVVPDPDGGLPSSRGWQVAEGAADSIAAARLFEASCPSVETIVVYGVSMGGNASGLAVAAGATRSDGTPLFDWWFDIEGATNVTETYQEARAVAQSGNEFAANAQADIEREMGGTFEEVPQVYLERTVVNRAADIAASGLRGVVLVHGLDDGLVPYNQTREMAARLAEVGVAYDVFTVATRGDGEPGTTLTGSLLGSAGYTSPFAGHASETSTTHLVGTTGFARLAALLNDGEAPGCREFVVDGVAGTAPDPATAPGGC